MRTNGQPSTIDLALLTPNAFDALVNALDQYVENTREAVELDPDNVDPREVASLAEAEALLDQLNGHVAALADR